MSDHPGTLLAPARRRPDAVRPVPARLPAARRPARRVLRAPARSATRWCSPPTAARRASASTRSRRSRSTISIPGSSVLSFGTAGCNLACKFCQNWDITKSREMDTLMDEASPEAIARLAARARLPKRRLHLQRPGDLRRVRDGHRRRLPRARHQDGRGHRRLHARRAAARVLREDGRGQRRPEGVHRGVLRQADRRRTCSRCSTRSSTSARDRRLVRDHDAAHPGHERLRRRDRGDVEVDRARAGARRAAALHRLPSRLQDDRHAADAAGDAAPRARHRAGGRPALRLHRQRARHRRRHDPLPRLRRAR